MYSYFDTEEKDKLTLKECKAILNANGDLYTDEQILRIRDYLYKLASIEVAHFNTLKKDERNGEGE